LEFFEDFRKFPSKGGPFFRCRSIVPFQSGQLNFSLPITKATGLMEYFEQCGQDTGISRTRPNSSLGIADYCSKRAVVRAYPRCVQSQHCMFAVRTRRNQMWAAVPNEMHRAAAMLAGLACHPQQNRAVGRHRRPSARWTSAHYGRKSSGGTV